MYFAVIIAFCLSFVALSLQDSLPSFADVLSQQKNLSSFSDVLTQHYPDLLTRIGDQTSQNPITVLAPSNAAFAKTVYYPVIGPAFSQNDIGAIRAILEYHVVTGSHPSKSLLPTFQYFPTWLTNSSFTNVTNGQVVGGVMQSGTPPIMVWTSGQSNRSPVLNTDISFQGGTIHIIDSLLIPPTSFPATAELFSTAAEPYQLTSFLGATYYSPNTSISSLATLLNETSDITIFAPNNVAMESVSSTLTTLALSSNSSSAFQDLLKYHIIVSPKSTSSEPWYSTLFPQNGSSLSLPTLNGETLTITFSSNSFFVNSARILTSDLLLENGVMHVLDNVLDEEKTDGKPNPSLATQVPVLSTGAVGGFNVSQAPFTTGLPNKVNTDRPTETGATFGAGGGGGGATATGTGSGAGSTGKAKSGGVKMRVDGSVGFMIICLLGLMMLI